MVISYFEIMSKYPYTEPASEASVDGILGGKLVDYEAFGRISGELVMDVLNGKAMENMELIEDTPYYYIFDYELIKKYDIPEHLIPEDAVLINKEESLLERYWTIFLGIGIIVVFLLIVSLILIADNLKRRKIQKELSESNDKLKSAYAELEKTEDILRQQNDKFLNLANNRVIDSLISLAHSLKLEITAEGIEEWDQYLQLKQGGCDYIQGYLFSKPVEANAAEKLFDHPFIMVNE
ncbi:EAL domain-containing protein [Acetobacterium carbinolicum]|uniref:EAL domain-containing protein n=1 Tax=Acetobacterium carbinolicum TaxID=52690 RepID=UPI003BF60317